MNEYHWGDFKGDPRRLMERYYDAHLYVASWGIHRVIFRLPCDLLHPNVVEDYRVSDAASAWITGEFFVLDAEYGVQAERYTNPDGASPNATQMTWNISERAPRSGSDLLPCPSIHWWWRYNAFLRRTTSKASGPGGVMASRRP